MSLSKSESESNQPEIKNTLTFTQSILSGSIAGATEVLIDHPLVSMKTRIQSGAGFTLNPKLLYRGLFINASSMIPITAMQVSLNASLKKLVLGPSEEPTHTQNFGIAFTAGFCSSVIGCPLEMIMIHQALRGGNVYSATRGLVHQGGATFLSTGLLATALRDGFFAAFYLAITPLLIAKMKPLGMNDNITSLVAGVCAGIGATLVSQAADTIKTVQQTTLYENRANFFATSKQMLTSGGVQSFFKGTIPRGARVVSAITIIGYVNEKVSQALRESNTPRISCE